MRPSLADIIITYITIIVPIVAFILLFIKMEGCPKGGTHIWRSDPNIDNDKNWDIHHRYQAFKGLSEFGISGSPDLICSKCGKIRRGSLWKTYQDMRREVEAAERKKLKK